MRYTSSVLLRLPAMRGPKGRCCDFYPRLGSYGSTRHHHFSATLEAAASAAAALLSSLHAVLPLRRVPTSCSVKQIIIVLYVRAVRAQARVCKLFLLHAFWARTHARSTSDVHARPRKDRRTCLPQTVASHGMVEGGMVKHIHARAHVRMDTLRSYTNIPRANKPMTTCAAPPHDLLSDSPVQLAA